MDTVSQTVIEWYLAFMSDLSEGRELMSSARAKICLVLKFYLNIRTTTMSSGLRLFTYPLALSQRVCS